MARQQLIEAGIFKVVRFLELGGSLEWNEYGSPVAKWGGHEYKLKPTGNMVDTMCLAIDALGIGRCLYENERHCKCCCEDTVHEQYGAVDSSGDHTECLKCGYTAYG